MILSHETATRLDEAFFSVLLSGIIPPTFKDYATNVYLSKMMVYYEARKQRIKSAIGFPLYVDVSDIISDLERVPKRTLMCDEVGSVLLGGLKLNNDKKTYCICTKWEFRKDKLGLILLDEALLTRNVGVDFTPIPTTNCYTNFSLKRTIRGMRNESYKGHNACGI